MLDTIQEDATDRFNEALVVLLAHFYDRKFNRRVHVSPEESDKGDIVWFRGLGRGKGSGSNAVNIAYCPPRTYGSNPEFLLHVRVYNPDEAAGVRDLLVRKGFDAIIHDNDPYCKADIDAVL